MEAFSPEVMARESGGETILRWRFFCERHSYSATAMDCHGNYLAVFHSVGAYCSSHFTRMVSELFYALDISVFLHLFAICFS